jgi:hypothetical protein
MPSLSFGAARFPPRIEKWKEIAPIIADELRTAMASTNAAITLGSSNEGPVARFVAASRSMITGHSLKAGAVGKALNRAIRDNSQA